MRIKVGDRVKFLNDTGSGEVTRIVDPKTALVQIDGGFEVPWLINDLVVDAGRYESDLEKDDDVTDETGNSPAEVDFRSASFSEKAGEESEQEPIGDEEIVLAFLPDAHSADFETYLINSSSYHFKYVIAREQEGELVLFNEGTLEAGVKIELGSYRPGNLNDEERYRIQGIFFNAGFYQRIPPVDKVITVVASELYRAENRRESDYFLEKAVLFSLYDWRKPEAGREAPGEPKIQEMEIDTEALKEAMFAKGDLSAETPVRSKKVELTSTQPVEVDLHIEHLMDNHKSLTNSEILDIQMTRFRSELEQAIQNKTRRIVFIHGVGGGRLKHELRRALDTEYKKIRYQDASFKEYGFGATMVIIH
jgi:hypothetical protein